MKSYKKPQTIAIVGNLSQTMIRFRGDWIQKLTSDGHKVYCLAAHYSQEDRDIILSWKAHPIDSFLNPKGLNPFKDLWATFKLVQKLKKIQPDVVFSYVVKPVIFGSLASWFAKVPRRVGMLEGLGNAFTKHQDGYSLKTKWIQIIQVLLYKISLPLLDTVIVLNPNDKKDLIDKYKIKVKETKILGAIGLDIQDFLYSPASHQLPISFIFVGRLLKEKGVFEYLQAAEKIKKKHPQVLFYLIGDLDKQNPFALSRDLLQKYIQKKVILFYENIPNSQVKTLLKKSSVFVLPSYREGFPRSTQEAMAIGRAVITTDVPGCRETVNDSENGFLIAPFSSMALVQKMQFFIDNPKEINKMGLKSRKLAEQQYNVHEVNQRLTYILLGDNFKQHE